MLYGTYANSVLHNTGGDLSRPAKFSAKISIPDILKTDVEGSTIDILCKSFQIPDIKMEPIVMKYKGHSIPVKSRVDFQTTVSVTFYLDEAQTLRQLFKDWLEGLDKQFIGDISSGTSDILGAPTRGERDGQILISALAWDESPLIDYGFKDVFPISVSGPAFATDSVSSVNEFTVEFAYTTFRSAKTGEYNWNNLFSDTIDAAADAVAGFLPDFSNNSKSPNKTVKNAADYDYFDSNWKK